MNEGLGKFISTAIGLGLGTAVFISLMHMKDELIAHQLLNTPTKTELPPDNVRISWQKNVVTVETTNCAVSINTTKRTHYATCVEGK